MKQSTSRRQGSAAVAAIYVRVSTEEQAAEGVSLADQEERARAYCALHGLAVLEVYRDEGVSAGKPLDERPRGAALVAAITSGCAQHVVAVKLDRLFRDAVDCLRTSQTWDRAGIALHLIDLGGQTLNTASAMGRFFLTVMAGAAEMERNLIRERTRAALHFKRAHGERLGTTPLGFRTPQPGAAMEPVAGELAVVRLILAARQRRQPTPFRTIAATLRAQGHRTKRGGQWYASTVKSVWDRRRQYESALSSEYGGD